jgi:hypothetical protein
MPLGCESIRSISTITTSALTEHDLPSRYGITLGREGGFKGATSSITDGKLSLTINSKKLSN